MADWLELGAEGRINTPGTGMGNWIWRAKEDAFAPARAQRSGPRGERRSRAVSESARRGAQARDAQRATTRRMPSDASMRVWMEELEGLE